MLNCTIANNANDDGGAGIHLQGSIYQSKIKNSVFWGNICESTTSGDQIWLENAATLAIDFSDVQGGPAEVYAESGCTLSWGWGMMDADPLFVNPARRDFRLKKGSPALALGFVPTDQKRIGPSEESSPSRRKVGADIQSTAKNEVADCKF